MHLIILVFDAVMAGLDSVSNVDRVLVKHRSLFIVLFQIPLLPSHNLLVNILLQVVVKALLVLGDGLLNNCLCLFFNATLIVHRIELTQQVAKQIDLFAALDCLVVVGLDGRVIWLDLNRLLARL